MKRGDYIPLYSNQSSLFSVSIGSMKDEFYSTLKNNGITWNSPTVKLEIGKRSTTLRLNRRRNFKSPTSVISH